MNAFINQHNTELDFILNKLYLAIERSDESKTKEVIITHYAQDLEDMDDLINATNFLKDNKIVEEIRDHSSGQKPVDSPISGEDEGDTVVFIKETYVFRPNILIKFLIETSRIPKYTLKFDKSSCEVIVNNKYLLSKLDFDGINYTFFSYAIDNPGKIIRKENLYKDAGKINTEKINKKDFLSILQNVIKNKYLIRVFFPQISKDSSYFRNNVTTKDLIGHKINEKSVNDYLKTRKKVNIIKI